MGIYCEIYVCENNKCFYGYCYVGINVFYLCDCDLGWIGKECDILDLCKFFICEYGGKCIFFINFLIGLNYILFVIVLGVSVMMKVYCKCLKGWEGERC